MLEFEKKKFQFKFKWVISLIYDMIEKQSKEIDNTEALSLNSRVAPPSDGGNDSGKRVGRGGLGVT